MSRVAGALGVSDQLGNLGFCGGAGHVEVEGNLLKGTWRAAQIVFVRHAERGADVDIGIFDWDLIQGRKLRQLGQQSKSGAGQEVLQRGRSKVVAAPLRWLVRLDHEPANAPHHVHVLFDMGDRTLGQDRNFLSVCARGVVRLLHPVEIDSSGLVTHWAVSLLTAIISMNGH